MSDDRSTLLFRRALARIPGGVNSPVRAWSAVGGSPRFVASASGAHITDVDGREYIDYVASWGPMLLGHGDPDVRAAIDAALALGTSFGATTESEVELAELVCELIPSIERVRLVSSGTEAAMSAIRVARAATGRKAIVKFAGCYHGHSDGLLVRAGSGATTFGVPDSPGVPAEIAGLTRLAQFNDLESVERVCDQDAAAIVIEPVAANMGVIPPQQGFLQGVREIANKRGALLIFDEIITGFRVALGGYQSLCSIAPDLTCLGKVLGGGLPVAAYGGRADLLDAVAPRGRVYQAGTLSGNPIAVAAGLATLRKLKKTMPYECLERSSSRLEAGLRAAIGTRAACVQRVGSLLTLFVGISGARNYEEALTADTVGFGKFFRAMLDQRIWLPPSQFEAWFVGTQHTDQDIDRAIAAATRALASA